MKIGKAIRILEHVANVPKIPKDPDLNEAQRLGSEALKLVQQLQSLPGRKDSFKLPGETEE
jgi:hypothetical protein